jgi:hypothetical protein
MRHPSGCGDPAADDVADHQPGLAVAQRDHVVPVAADLGLGAAGEIAGAEAHARNVREALAQQAVLERGRDRALDLDLVRRPAQPVERRADDGVAALGIGAWRPGEAGGDLGELVARSCLFVSHLTPATVPLRV